VTIVANTWEGISSHAARVGAAFPELVAAQWSLESSFGKHFPAQNNPFGLKGVGSGNALASTKEFYDGEWIEITAGFIQFPSLAAAIEYLAVHWYKDWAGYRGVNNAPSREAAARMLQSEGYATDPGYADKLIKLMNEHAPLAMSSPITLSDAAKFYKGLAHQKEAWDWLQARLSPANLSEFTKLYRSAPVASNTPLSVPYFSQRDNASGQGYRECFSSSCAMIAAFYGKVKTDDEYNVIRSRFGDSTNSSAQIRALESLGLKPVFNQGLRLADLQQEIKAGRPVGVGWLHHSNYHSPSGGGHWSVVVGLSDGGTIQHDPYGMPDLVKGGHTSAQGGKYATFPNQYWLPRWEVKGGDGWGMLVRP